jgi:type I restriction enzyme R subunit
VQPGGERLNSPAQPRAALTDILENYAQVLEERNEKIGRKMRTQTLPRYSQLRVCEFLPVAVTAAI